MSASNVLLPWLKADWQRLLRYIQDQRVPQALLISGLADSGELILARKFAQSLLCMTPSVKGNPCGECLGCQLFLTHNHPDFIVVKPEETGRAIVVDRVRQLVATLALAPQYTQYRVVLFENVEQLNTAAANSLLKTLEEPNKRTVILLLTDQPGQLPATILSRCQRFILNRPKQNIAIDWLCSLGHERDQAKAYLALAYGAPLKAQKLAQTDVLEQQKNLYQSWLQLARGLADPLVIVEQWQQSSIDQVIDWLISWLIDMIRMTNVTNCARLYNPELSQSLRQEAQRLDLRQLFVYLDFVWEAKKLLSTQVNQQLMLESLLIEWCLLERS